MKKVEDEVKLKNALTIRWADEAHRTLTDQAWRMRISGSELVRRLVEEGLARMTAEEGVGVAVSGEAPPAATGAGSAVQV